MYQRSIETISQVKEICQELYPKVGNIGATDINYLKDYLWTLVSELDFYNQLLCEKFDTLQDVSMWESIKSCVKSSNIDRNKTSRPKVKIEFLDENNGELIVLDVEKHRNEEYKDCLNLHNCLPIMQIVPTLLIDNAFKYCNTGGEITIKIKKDELMTSFSIENLGPQLTEEEQRSIWNSGFRGMNASTLKVEGQGLGLYLFKIIMGLHSYLAAEYSINVGDNSILINQINYSSFTLKFSLSNNPICPIGLMDVSAVKEKVYDYVLHQYIRLMPRVCKLSKLLFDKLYGLYLDDDVVRMAYEIKDCLISHYVYLQKINDSFYSFSETTECGQVRIDKYLKRELDYVKDLYNIDFTYSIQRGESYLGTQTVSPFIDVFIHDFTLWLLNTSNVNDIQITTYTGYIEIVSEEEFCYDAPRVDCWRSNLEKCNMQIDVEKKQITLS